MGECDHGYSWSLGIGNVASTWWIDENKSYWKRCKHHKQCYVEEYFWPSSVPAHCKEKHYLNWMDLMQTWFWTHWSSIHFSSSKYPHYLSSVCQVLFVFDGLKEMSVDSTPCLQKKVAINLSTSEGTHCFENFYRDEENFPI